jgi:hypothetical protein
MDETLVISAGIAVAAAVLVLAFLPGRTRAAQPILKTATTGARS